MIYLDNAATTKPCAECLRALNEAAESRFGNASSLHMLGTDSIRTIAAAKKTLIAALTRDKTRWEGDVLFTSGATESNNTALLSLLKPHGSVRRIVSTAIEHPSVSKALDVLEQRGFEVIRLRPCDFGGSEAFAKGLVGAADENTALVSAMAVNNETGFRLDVPTLYKEIKRKAPKTLVHIDAVQGFLKMPLDGDLISVSGHKIHSTKGIGALFIRKGARVLPLLHGGGQQGKLRSGTEPVELIAGFEAAVKAYRGNAEHFAALKAHLLERLGGIDDVVINSGADCVPNIVNFSVRGVRSEIMLHSLEEAGVCVSSGSACSKGHKSDVLPAFGISDRDADCAVRVSFCGENTAEELDIMCDKIASTVERIRR